LHTSEERARFRSMSAWTKRALTLPSPASGRGEQHAYVVGNSMRRKSAYACVSIAARARLQTKI
jgi:hypothetical protein